MFASILFFCTLFAAALFHRWEHVVFENDLRAIAADPPRIAVMDWRVLRNHNGVMTIRRAFNPRGFSGAARYATPLALFTVMLLGVGSWKMAAGYAAVCAIKWFACEAVVDTRPGRGEYSVLLLGQRLFGTVF